MWLDHVSLSSMKTPRYLMQVVRVIVLSLSFILKSISLLFLRLTIMYEVFKEFKDNLLKCSHSLTFSRSVLTMLCSSVLLLPEMDNTVSSAKSVGVSFVVDGKSFIYSANN